MKASRELGDLDERAGLLSGSLNSEREDAQPQGFMPGVAYAFTLNMIVGAGVLGLPYAFYNGGVLLSAVLLTVLTGLALSTMLFLVEVSARAESWVASQESTWMEDHDKTLFVIRGRKFELNELCAIFLKITVKHDSCWRFLGNSRGEIFFFRRFMEISLILYSIGSMWLYAAVFGSSLSAVVPLPFLPAYKDYMNAHGHVPFDVCSQSNWGDMYDYCHTSFLCFLVVFLAMMMVMCLMEMSAQRTLQMSLTSFGLFIMTLMVATSSAAMATSPQPGSSTHAPFLESAPLANMGGFGKAFTTALFAQLCHQGVPSFVLLLKDKKMAQPVFSAALLTTLALYCSLGVVCSLYFGPNIQPIVTLNWRAYTGGQDHAPIWAMICSYLIVLFPVVTVAAAFPIYGIVLVQNLTKSIPAHVNERHGKLINTVLRVVVCCLPIAGAAVLKDVAKILEFNGILGCFIAFLIPALLQYRSRKMCMDKWGAAGERTPYHWFGSHPYFCIFVLAVTTPAFGLVVYEVLLDYISG